MCAKKGNRNKQVAHFAKGRTLYYSVAFLSYLSHLIIVYYIAFRQITIKGTTKGDYRDLELPSRLGPSGMPAARGCGDSFAACLEQP